MVETVPCPGGFLRASLLLLLMELPGHGYALHDRLLHLGQDVETAALYRVLHALEHEGLVHSAWECSDQGPARRSYELSWAGQAELGRCARQVAAQRDLMQHFLDRWELSSATSLRLG